MKSVTIAIPTHNRARELRDTLASLMALVIPQDVGAAANSATPFPIRRVLESRQGSSFARNRAVDEARGDFICFIDDDATAERDWLRAMLSALETRGLDAACGMVLPRWSTPP